MQRNHADVARHGMQWANHVFSVDNEEIVHLYVYKLYMYTITRSLYYNAYLIFFLAYQTIITYNYYIIN